MWEVLSGLFFFVSFSSTLAELAACVERKFDFSASARECEMGKGGSVTR